MTKQEREDNRIKCAQWREENREHYREYQRNYQRAYQKRTDWATKWRKANHDYYYLKQRMRYRLDHGADLLQALQMERRYQARING